MPEADQRHHVLDDDVDIDLAGDAADDEEARQDREPRDDERQDRQRRRRRSQSSTSSAPPAPISVSTRTPAPPESSVSPTSAGRPVTCTGAPPTSLVRDGRAHLRQAIHARLSNARGGRRARRWCRDRRRRTPGPRWTPTRRPAGPDGAACIFAPRRSRSSPTPGESTVVPSGRSTTSASGCAMAPVPPNWPRMRPLACVLSESGRLKSSDRVPSARGMSKIAATSTATHASATIALWRKMKRAIAPVSIPIPSQNTTKLVIAPVLRAR